LQSADSLIDVRRIAIAVIAVLALLLATVEGSAASTHGATVLKCPSPGSRILLADTQATIYTVREGLIEHLNGKRKVVPIVATRGCGTTSKRSFRLDWEYAEAGSPESGSPIPRNLVLSGPIVAYEESLHGGNRYTEGRGEEPVEEWHVVVRDLRTGKILHRVPTGMNDKGHPKFVGDGPTVAIVVKANGAAAWITDTVQSENRYQVHALDETGERILAMGSNIDPHSLALSGSTLYWTQGGKPASTSLG
jgi:hypothetical protein